MGTDINNHEISFAEMPPKAQVKLLWAHNQYLLKQLRQLNQQLVPAVEQVKLVQDRNRNLLEQMNRLTSQFERYEESDARLMEENKHLKTQLAECSKSKINTQPLRRTEREKDKSNGRTAPASGPQIAKFKKRYG